MILILSFLELQNVLLFLLTWSTKGGISLWMTDRTNLVMYVSYLMRQEYIGYLGTIFSIGMMCSSGGFKSLHNVVYENEYVDVKCKY